MTWFQSNQWIFSPQYFQSLFFFFFWEWLPSFLSVFLYCFLLKYSWHGIILDSGVHSLLFIKNYFIAVYLIFNILLISSVFNHFLIISIESIISVSIQVFKDFYYFIAISSVCHFHKQNLNHHFISLQTIPSKLAHSTSVFPASPVQHTAFQLFHIISL